MARLGGDEFVVWMTSAARPDLAVERLRSNLDQQNCTRARSAQLAASVGLLEVPLESSDSLEALLARADARMYENKRMRRGNA